MTTYVNRLVTGSVSFPPDSTFVFSTPVTADAIPLTVEALASIGAPVPRAMCPYTITFRLWGLDAEGVLTALPLATVDDDLSLVLTVSSTLTNEVIDTFPCSIVVDGDLGEDPPTGTAGQFLFTTDALELDAGRYRFEFVWRLFDGEVVIASAGVAAGWLDVLPR